MRKRLYTYETKNRRKHHRWFEVGTQPASIKVGRGIAVLACLANAARQTVDPWPLHSEAMGVHPSQADEAAAYSREIGVPTEFDGDGRPIFTSRGHRKRYAEAHGYFDADGGYGDPQKR